MKKVNELVKKFKNYILTVLAVILVLFVLGNKISIFEKAETDKGKLIGDAINSICQLATTEYDYTYIDEFNNQSEINLFITKLSVPLTNKYFVGAFEGTIKYGIDLNQIKKENIEINEDSKLITIEMPKVIKIGHETERTKFYAMDNNLLNPFTPEDGENFKEVHKEDAEKRAFERGILGRIQKRY